MPSLTTPGFRLVDAGELYNFLYSLYSVNVVTAAAGGAGGATRLRYGINDITVASASQGVMLPPALPGKIVTVINDTAVAVTIYGMTGNPNDTVTPNASVAPAASVSLPTGGTAEFICGKAHNWKTLMSA